jgi:hypothetical protein
LAPRDRGTEKNQAQQAALDEEQFFNKPDAAAGLEVLDSWSKIPGWKLNEAVALSFGKDPEVVREGSLSRCENNRLLPGNMRAGLI